MSSSFNPLKTQDPELIDQLKERLPQALFEKFKDSLSVDGDRLKFAEYKVRVLEERLRLMRIEKYGPGSEKLSDDQLELLELEPGVSSAEVEAESQREQMQLPLKATRKHPGPMSAVAFFITVLCRRKRNTSMQGLRFEGAMSIVRTNRGAHRVTPLKKKAERQLQ